MKNHPRPAPRPHVPVVEPPAPGRPPLARRGIAFALLILLCVAPTMAYVIQTTLRSRAAESQAATERSSAASLIAPPRGPRLMFRDTALGDGYGKLALAP